MVSDVLSCVMWCGVVWCGVRCLGLCCGVVLGVYDGVWFVYLVSCGVVW